MDADNLPMSLDNVELNGCRAFSNNCPSTPADDELLSINSELLMSETSSRSPVSPVSPAPTRSFTPCASVNTTTNNSAVTNSLIENCRQADEVSSLPSPTSSDSRVPFIRPIKNPSELDKKVSHLFVLLLDTKNKTNKSSRYCSPRCWRLILQKSRILIGFSLIPYRHF